MDYNNLLDSERSEVSQEWLRWQSIPILKRIVVITVSVLCCQLGHSNRIVRYNYC